MRCIDKRVDIHEAGDAVKGRADLSMSEHINKLDADSNLSSSRTASDSDLSIGYMLTSARTRMLQEMDTSLSPFGLTGAQFTILRRIAEGAANTAAELCRILQYDTGSMTRMLDRLEEKGAIVRQRSPDDRRVVNIQLTESGAEQYPKLREEVRRAVDTMFSSLSADELQQLRGLLSRLLRTGK